MTPPTLTLRPVIATDLPIFYIHQRDPLAAEIAAFPFREFGAFMEHWQKILQDETGFIRTVLENGIVVGNVVSFVMDDHREVGYWFGREYWGRGIATRALSAFLQEETRRPLYAWVANRNKASQRVLEKCGFKHNGEAEDGQVFLLE